MSSSVVDTDLNVRVMDVHVTDDTLTVDLEDGRTISLPLQWYPRLQYGTPKERANFEIGVYGIHWPDLDEDLSTRGLILGHRSGENPAILKFWLDNRKKGRKVTLEDWMKQRRKRTTKNKTK